jgi:hypothetical protein
MTTIATNLQAVRARIARAAQAAGRSPEDIALIAVSKSFPAQHIEEAHAAGQGAFGESYAREAVEKITKLAHLPLVERVAQAHRENDRERSGALVHSAGVASPEGPLLLPLEWHFIGPIQSNKTGAIAAHFQWVHSVGREKIAQRLNAARPQGLPPLNICIQVNISGEASKNGISPGEEIELAQAVARMPRLKLRGLMAIPEPTPDTELQRRRFALLREMKDRLAGRGYALDTLSMGMSDDFEAAIAEGATMVRVGTAIFGQRQKN